jgi:hypothetical protein
VREVSKSVYQLVKTSLLPVGNNSNGTSQVHYDKTGHREINFKYGRSHFP